MHTYPLITTIVVSITFAFLLGFLANRLKLPTILGYLIAGVLLGPHTPGFIADISVAKQLAEIGIILLMFGVGLHFSIKDLISVNKIAVPGAILQILSTIFLTLFVGFLLNFKLIEGIIFGLAISVASTLVMLRALEEHHMLRTHAGKTAIGWLIVEDIAMVLMIVLIPMIAAGISEQNSSLSSLKLDEIIYEAFMMLAKIAVFAVFMMSVGRRLLPRILVQIAKTKSRELMSLGTLTISLGFAFIAYTIFGASFALGAFLAGLVLNESKIGQKSAKNSLPLRDIFAVLFFISVGMLFNPSVIFMQPALVIITLIIIMVGKPIFTYAITRTFHQSMENSLVISVSLAQVGEFSFILAAMALKLNLISQTLYDAILFGALVSIALNPFLFKLAKIEQVMREIKKPNKSNPPSPK